MNDNLIGIIYVIQVFSSLNAVKMTIQGTIFYRPSLVEHHRKTKLGDIFGETLGELVKEVSENGISFWNKARTGPKIVAKRDYIRNN